MGRPLPRALAVAVSVSPLFVACGGQAPPAAQSAQAAPGGGTDPRAGVGGALRPVTQAQLVCAHYRSADGTLGLVLDRTQAEKPKMRMDGQTVTLELTMQEDRSAGTLRGYFLTAPDGTRIVHIGVGGDVSFYRSGDELPLTSDAPATPLGAAAIRGQYVEPPPEYQPTVDRLKAIAVRTKDASFKPEDSASIAKINAALTAATADMFVRYQSHGATSWLPSEQIVPQAFEGVQFGGVARETADKWNPHAAGLLKYGGKNQGFSEYDSRGNHMQVMKLDGYPPRLADGTPGIVWEVDTPRAVFVTLDGGRYSVDLSSAEKGQTLEPGAGPPASWPPPLQESLLDVPAVSSLAKAGAVPKKLEDDLLTLDEDWNHCAQKAWAGAQRAIDSNRFTEADRKDWEKRVRATCAGPIAKQEKMLVGIIEARNKERLALYAAAKARVAAVGADR